MQGEPLPHANEVCISAPLLLLRVCLLSRLMEAARCFLACRETTKRALPLVGRDESSPSLGVKPNSDRRPVWSEPCFRYAQTAREGGRLALRFDAKG